MKVEFREVAGNAPGFVESVDSVTRGDTTLMYFRTRVDNARLASVYDGLGGDPVLTLCDWEGHQWVDVRLVEYGPDWRLFAHRPCRGGVSVVWVSKDFSLDWED